MNDPATKIVPRDYHDIISKVASVKDVDVEKLRQLMEMQEQWEKRQAETHWNNQMALAQAEMRPVSVDSTNPSTRSKYASLPGLMEAVQPIYSKYGFAVSFNDETPLERGEGWLRLAAYVTNGAHKARYDKWLPVSASGLRGQAAMTPTHASIAAVTYGRRALLKMIFNIAEIDDDGNAAWPRGDAAKATRPVQEPATVISSDAKAELFLEAIDQARNHTELHTWHQMNERDIAELFPADKGRVNDAFKKRAQEFADAQGPGKMVR